MRFFEEKEILSRNPDFELVSDEELYYFVYKSRYKIITDRLGKLIWDCLPGNADEIKGKVRKQLHVSDDLVEQFLFVLNKGNLIGPSHKTEGKTEIDSSLRESDTHKDLISVIVITYNGEKHIHECFRSLLDQSYKNLEIIAIDNGSKDQTVSMMKRDFPQVKLFSLTKNIHYVGGVNFGFSRASGRYLLVLNQDVELKEDCILHLYNAAEKGIKVGAVVPMMIFYHMRGFINGIGNQIRNYGWGSDNFIGCVDIGQFTDLEEVPSACFGAVFLNREALEEVGKLDKRYKSYYEDVDWSFRCWLRGLKIVPAAQAVVYHKFGASYREDSEKLKLVAKNRLRLVLKLFQGRIMLGFLKRYIKEDIKKTLSLLKKKKYSLVFAYTKAYFLLLLDMPFLFFQRRSIMRNKNKELNERFVLEKNPELFSCCDDKGNPIIDSGKIFEYYRWEFIRMSKGKKFS